MIEVSLARSAQGSPEEKVECFRHNGEECSRCDGSGYRTVKRCAGCGEAAGSISAGTGKPAVQHREDGLYYHVLCRPGFIGTASLATMLERMGG